MNPFAQGTRLYQIYASHLGARPTPENPAWQHTHRDLGFALEQLAFAGGMADDLFAAAARMEPRAESDDAGHSVSLSKGFARTLHGLLLRAAIASAEPLEGGLRPSQSGAALILAAYDDAASVVVLEEPRSGDWLYDDPHVVAKVLRQRGEKTAQEYLASTGTDNGSHGTNEKTGGAA